MWKGPIGYTYEVLWEIPNRSHICRWHRYKCSLWHQNIWVAHEVSQAEGYGQ